MSKDLPGDMSCQELIELVTEYFEGTLSAADRTRFEEHLAGCSGCRHYVDQMHQTIQLVGKIEEDDLSEDAKDHLLRTFRTWKQGQ